MVVAATVPSPGWARTAPLQPVVFVLLSAAPRRRPAALPPLPWLSRCLSGCPHALPSLLPTFPSFLPSHLPLPSLCLLFPGLFLLLFLFPSLLSLLLLTVLAAASTCFTLERS